jgi:S1-C subfamily serine protease
MRADLRRGVQPIQLPAVSGVDWLIVVFTLLLALYGYAQGFLVGALSLAGFALGAFAGTRLAPLVLPSGAHSPYAPVLGLVGALMVGGLLATGFEGVAMRARSLLLIPGLRAVDGLLGAGLTACVALGVAWIVGAIAVQTSGSSSLQRDIQGSVILRTLNEVLPPSGPILHALARFDPLPSVRGPSAGVAAPSPAVLARPGVRQARRGVVRVVGTACGLGVEGSGWVAGPGLVVTNAHVVAGETNTVVQPGGQAPGLAAHAVAFDPHDDIALLRVPGLDLPPLTLVAHPRAGTAAAILGYPLDGPFDARPGRIGHTETVNTQDAYGNGPIQRSITTLRGYVRPGNSGGPLVDGAGQVVGTVFAAIVGAPGQRGGFAVPNELVAHQLAHPHMATVPTGQCAG